MQLDEVLKRIGVFALVLVVIIAGGVAASTSGGTSSTPEYSSLTVEAYSGNDTVASVPQESGGIELSANATGDVVLIDASHGASIDREQLTPIVDTLTENGAEVRFLSEEGGHRPGPRGGSQFNASLRKADAFITFGVERQYTESQVNGLEAFAEAGGRVLVVKEPSQIQRRFIIFRSPEREQTVPMPLTPLTTRFGVSFGNGYLYNMHQYDNNYRNVYATPTGSSQLTEDVDRVVLHESTTVQGPNTVMRTVDRTELSQTRKQGRYGVVAQSGNMTAVGDASVFGQDYYRRGDNEVFVGNVLDFLVSADKQPSNAPTPPEPETPSGPERPPESSPEQPPTRS